MVFGILAFCFVLMGPLGLIFLGLSLSVGHRWKHMWLLSLAFEIAFLSSFTFMAEQATVLLILMILGSFGMGFTCPNRSSKRSRIALFVVAILVLAFYLIILWIISGAPSNISGGTTIQEENIMIWSSIVGALIGVMTSTITNREESMGCIYNTSAGLVGSFVGQSLFGFWGPSLAGMTILPSILGAITVTAVIDLFFGK